MRWVCWSSPVALDWNQYSIVEREERKEEDRLEELEIPGYS
jgi:hypothetical protein